MKLERGDWLVADGEFRAKADSWWATALAGAAGEAMLAAALFMLAREGGALGICAGALLAARAICGSIGCYCWFSADKPPEFWGFRAKWIMQFMPGSLLAWRRSAWIGGFIRRLAAGDPELRIKLAEEQLAYYKKGSEISELGAHRREMACWASAARECLVRWADEREAEKMKSAQERLRALAEMGLGRAHIQQSMLSLEKLEIAESSGQGRAEGAKIRL